MNGMKLWKATGVVAVAGLIIAVAPLRAQTVTATVTAGTQPIAAAVNPVTNKIYVANAVSKNVIVIDGAINTITTVAAGTTPLSIAVNPVTNQI